MEQGVPITGRAAAWVWRYTFALLLMAGALGVTLLTLKASQIRIPFLFFAAILIAGWYGGRGPAWVAAGLSILAVDYYFEFPTHSLKISAGEETYLIPFAVCAVVAAWSSSWRSRFEASTAKGDDSQGVEAENPQNKES